MSKLIFASNNENLLMEGLHKGYMKAIASCAACTCAEYGPDINGIDIKLGHEGVLDDIGFQLKSTYDWRFDGDDLVYDLKVESYNQLVGYSPRVPSFLGLMLFPRPGEEWHKIVEGEGLTIRHAMYWEFLGGRPVSTNSRTVTLRIPRRKLLTAEWLDELFKLLHSRRLRDIRAALS